MNDVNNNEDNDESILLKSASDYTYHGDQKKDVSLNNGAIRFSVDFNSIYNKKIPDNSKESYEFFSFKEKEFFSKRTLLDLLPTFFAIIIYSITLKGCHEPQFVCLEKYPLSFLKYVVILLSISALFYVFQLFLYTRKIINTKQILFTISSLIFLCFIFDTGSDLKSHGSYNRIILFFFILFYIGLYYILIYLFIFLKKFPIPVIFVIVLIGVYSNYKMRKIIENSCGNWLQGFNESFIDNSMGNCKIYPPKVCYFEIFHGVFDFSKFFGETCENTPNNDPKNTLDNIQDKNTKILGFPRSESWKFFPNSTYGEIQKTAMRNAINMENRNISEEIKKNIEVTVNYHKNPPVVEINLKKNYTLVNERAKIFEKFKKNVRVKNVLYVFIDSLSRVNFRRKLPRLYKWLESKHSSINKNTKSNNLNHESFQFFKYHGVGRFTGINMVPALLGVFNVYYNGKHFIRDYKEHGYITGQTLTFCGREVFDLDSGAIEKMKWDTHDHEMISLFCDGNFTPYEGSHYPLLTGPNSIRRRCLYGKSALSYSLEYAKQFFEKYSYEPKFFKIGITEAHEGTNEVIKYSDEELYNFFVHFENKGYLENTAVIFHSDHGVSMIGPYSIMGLEDFVHELVLPSFFVIIPKSAKNYNEIRKNLVHNENSIVTPFNVYNTLKSFINDRKFTFYSMEDDLDILNDKIPRNRDCEKFHSEDYYDEKIEFICRCKK